MRKSAPVLACCHCRTVDAKQSCHAALPALDAMRKAFLSRYLDGTGCNTKIHLLSPRRSKEEGCGTRLRGDDVAAARRRVLGSSLSNAQLAGLVAQENMLGASLRDNSRDNVSTKVPAGRAPAATCPGLVPKQCIACWARHTRNMLGTSLRDNSRDDAPRKVPTGKAAYFSRAFEGPHGTGHLLFQGL